MSCNCNDNNKNLKSTYRSKKEKEKIIRRLNIIEGQVRGINKMIVDDRYCDDVLIQIAAVNKSLKTLGNIILESHLKSCVARDVKSGQEEILEDVMKLIKKLQ